ncbi:hypothetical protein LSPCS325_23610 [Lysinibacillus sp. CTST325]
MTLTFPDEEMLSIGDETYFGNIIDNAAVAIKSEEL